MNMTKMQTRLGRCHMAQSCESMSRCACRDCYSLSLVNRNDPDESPLLFRALIPKCVQQNADEAVTFLAAAVHKKRHDCQDSVTWHQVLIGENNAAFQSCGVYVSQIQAADTIELGMDDTVPEI